MKASGQLLFGIPSGDGSVIHYDYTVILPVIRHTVNALQATMEALGETTSAAAHMYYRVAVLAEVIQSLGSLSADEITAELLLDGLTDDDMDLLDAELAGLKKADAHAAGLSGLRRAILALGQYGIRRQRQGMTPGELQSWLDDLARLQGKTCRPCTSYQIPQGLQEKGETVNA
jgi:hypothetical protein